MLCETERKIGMQNKALAGLAMIVGLILGMTGTADATPMTVEMTGFISGKTAPFVNNTSVQVGDLFGLTFNYDDSQQTTQQALVNGNDLYTIVTQPFQVQGLAGWWGTLPQEIALNNTSFANGTNPGWGVEQSWYRPLSTLHHNDWEIEVGGSGSEPFSFKIVTNYNGSPGYGWWAVGSNNAYGGTTSSTIDAGYLTITAFNLMPTASVPEPSSLLLLGSGLLGLAAWRRKQSA